MHISLRQMVVGKKHHFKKWTKESKYNKGKDAHRQGTPFTTGNWLVIVLEIKMIDKQNA